MLDRIERKSSLARLTVQKNKEVGQRTVIFLSDGRIVVYENGQLIKTCSYKWDKESQHWFFFENSIMHFLSDECKLIKWNLQSFKEKVLMRDVYSMSGVLSDPHFVTISFDGLMQTGQVKKQLKEDFPKMQQCAWSQC